MSGSTQSQTPPRHVNRLIHETSPYLLQHAHNPVDWYPWGEEALAKAKAEQKPILLSIGYSACHWCHVMERESFEDEAIAALMNRHFVNIKVDREERPDLDDIYMNATLALNQGQGGWPMTVFLAPDQRPFFAGTYFPPADSFGRPGFASLLTHIAELWERQRDDLTAQAGQLTEYLQKKAGPLPAGDIGENEIRNLVAQLAESFDKMYGGFGPAPKFPPSTALSLLLRHHRRTGEADALAMVTKTLDGMAQGGMYDHIGGGFARYATDQRWLVPHFEKMLYDNALLTRVYLEGHQVTGNPFYARIAREILDYVLREMTGPEGGFFSATDADSEGVEGKFYVWTPAEVEAVLGPDEAAAFCVYYDITDEGNWEGKSIPNTPRTLERVASRLSINVEKFRRSVEAGRAKLYEARRRRVPPGLDDKVLTAWNGMMLGAMAEGYRVLGEPRYLAGACRAADFVLTALSRPDGGLYRTYRQGRAHLPAYLEDYAFLAEGLLDLYEAGGGLRFLREAARLAERILADFGDPAGGGFYDTARGHEALIMRHRDGIDGATSSANATAASTLARLSHHLDRPALREAASAAVSAYGQPIRQIGRAFCKSLAVVDFLLEGPVELALVGAPGEAGYEALAREIGRRYLPNRILAHHDPTSGTEADLPLLAGKGLVGGRAALYVCRNFACQAPVTEPAEVDGALAGRTAAGAEPIRAGIAIRRRGRATPEGTAARAARFLEAGLLHGYAALGTTGLTVSRLGFGGYRVDDETPTHREALAAALLAGCMLIDTSTNYTDGGSERLVGSVLTELEKGGRLPREEVVVVSKIGYVQGQNLTLAQEREAAGKPFPEMVRYMDGCWHCLHPEFLQDQLSRSLDRLQLDTLDVCLLHNPEYYFSDAKHRGRGEIETLREEFYRRLGEAFRFFESQVAAGRIGWYGVSSNTAVNPPDDPEATSLARMLEAAAAAGGAGNHFRVLQVPMNLFESGAVLQPNTGPDGARTVLDLAAETGIAVLGNRPLNAYAGTRMIRLADYHIEDGGVEASPEELLHRVGALEAEYRERIAARLQVGQGGTPPADWFRWADQLQRLPAHLEGLDQWMQVEEQMIDPMVSQTVLMLDQGLANGPVAETWASWRERYLPALDALLEAFRAKAARQSQAASEAVAAAVDPRLPITRQGETLSRKALWVLASTPGMTAILLGMRDPEYVEDGMEILKWPPLSEVRKIYEAVREVRVR
ncbi:MAG TPA: aldo/keto reductase [Candidatus Methylomirabilis sp.]|nr:aldo/keto reductase [Candidatus Methylomirabilis sp.]